MFRDPQFYYTIGALIGTTLYSVLLGTFARTAFVAKTRSMLGFVAVAIFALSLYNSIVSVHMPLGWILLVVGCIWSGVFFLGAMVVVNQDLTHENGSIHIKKNSLLYFFLTKCCLLDPDKPRTLCSISWIGMLAIIAWPIASVFLSIVSVVVGLVGFLFTGRNPITIVKAIADQDTYGFRSAKFRYIPAVYIGGAALIWLCILLSQFSIVMWIYEFIAVVLVVGVVAYGVAKAYIKMFPPEPGEIDNGPSPWDKVYRNAFVPTGRALKTGTITPIVLIFKVIATIKKRVCPAIVID